VFANSKQRTILMVTNNYTPFSGGVVSSLLSTCAELRRHGHRVVVVTFDFLADGAQEPDVIRLRCAARFMYRGNHCVLPWRMGSQLAKIINDLKPDLIHVHHPFLLGASVAQHARRHKIPLVFTHHTLYEDYVHYVPLPQRITRPITRWLVRRFCKLVTTVIVPGASIARYLAQQGVGHTVVVPSGILPCFIQESYTLKRIAADKPVELLSVSRFVPEKSIEFLLEVVAKLGVRYHITLIGYGASGAALRVYAYERLGLSSEQVQFIEHPSKEHMSEWYRRAHLFLFASITETQGLVLAEAMAFATPVIARTGPGVVDCVVEGVNGYLVTSVDEMVARVREITAPEQRARYEVLQREAFATAQNYYPRKTVQELLNVYKTLLP
jgi:1,2-diacylglycerol 3-alpha-glucosyltransferase